MVLAAAGFSAAQTPRTDVPAYSVRYLGAGTAVAINAANQAAGYRDGGTVRRAVLFDAGTMLDLPPLSDLGSCEATDINDVGTIVGFCAASVYQTGRAVIWTRSGSTYSVAAIPTFTGDIGSAAAAINNLGQVTGLHYFRLSTGLQVAAGFLWQPPAAPIELLQTYGINDFPVDINDAGQILAGQKVVDVVAGVVTDLGVPSGPPAYIYARPGRLSASGMVAATGIPASSSGPQRLLRHRDGNWQVLGGWGQYDGASAVNEAGTVVGHGVGYLGSYGSTIKGVVWFDQMRTLLYIDDFLIEEARDWIITGAADLNGDGAGAGGVPGVGRIVGVGKNTSTGQYGAVLLEPVGALPVPLAPSGLNAAPRPATWQQPFNAIVLSWNDNSITDYGFAIERREAGQASWTEISRAAGRTYDDTTGILGVTYEYRVRAIGLAGLSAPSAEARATFPSTAVDTTAPTLTIVAPADGAGVSGTVQIVVDIADDRGVSYVDIQYQPNMGQAQVCSDSAGGVLSYRLTCSWSTRNLAPGVYVLTAYASDAIGNYATRTITLTVGETTNAVARVSSISLSTSKAKGATLLTGAVTIVEQGGKYLRNANVRVMWTTPSGSVTAEAYSDRKGVARFSLPAARGEYTLTVTGVVLAGYAFDAAGSQLSRSIVVQ